MRMAIKLEYDADYPYCSCPQTAKCMHEEYKAHIELFIEGFSLFFFCITSLLFFYRKSACSLESVKQIDLTSHCQHDFHNKNGIKRHHSRMMHRFNQ